MIRRRYSKYSDDNDNKQRNNKYKRGGKQHDSSKKLLTSTRQLPKMRTRKLPGVKLEASSPKVPTSKKIASKGNVNSKTAKSKNTTTTTKTETKRGIIKKEKLSSLPEIIKREVSGQEDNHIDKYNDNDDDDKHYGNKKRKSSEGNPDDAIIQSHNDDEDHEDEEERAISQLNKSGAINQVIGSQSLLSQELLDMSQQQYVTGFGTQASQQPKHFARNLGLIINSESESGNEDESDSPNDQKPSAKSKSPVAKKRAKAKDKEDSNDDDDDEDGGGNNREHYTNSMAVSQDFSAGPLSLIMEAAARVDADQREASQAIREDFCFNSASQLLSMSKQRESVVKKRDSSDDDSYSDTSSDQRLSKRRRTLPKRNYAAKASTIATPTKVGSSDNGSRAAAANSKRPATTTPTTPNNSKTKTNNTQKPNQHVLAQQAAELAAQAISDPEVAKNLLLCMALVRINPRCAPQEYPPRGSVIEEGFFWGSYPPLEILLRNHMREYYELSVTKCQSKLQQEFNNTLVVKVRQKARDQGWTFGKQFCDNDKHLRDRIRCFFKTHIQNAKKRLRTMVKNPTKKANAKALAAHLTMIRECRTTGGGGGGGSGGEGERSKTPPPTPSFLKHDDKEMKNLMPEAATSAVDRATMRKIRVNSAAKETTPEEEPAKTTPTSAAKGRGSNKKGETVSPGRKSNASSKGAASRRSATA